MSFRNASSPLRSLLNNQGRGTFTEILLECFPKDMIVINEQHSEHKYLSVGRSSFNPFCITAKPQ